MPRPLSSLEESIIRKLLSVDFPGASEFVSQIAHTRVAAKWSDGSPSLYLHVSSDAPKSSFEDGELPVSGEVTDPRGTVTGFITLWAEDGFLHGLEYAWHTDRCPVSLPNPADVLIKRFK